MNRSFWLVKGLKFAFFAALFIALAGFVTMQLWNWLMPAIFGLPLLSFGQAFGLLVLSRLLFGGFHRGGGGTWKARAQEHWRNKMDSRMQGMTEEEREKFRQKMSTCAGPAWMRRPVEESQQASSKP